MKQTGHLKSKKTRPVREKKIEAELINPGEMPGTPHQSKPQATVSDFRGLSQFPITQFLQLKRQSHILEK